jgi:hypothetical protein
MPCLSGRADRDQKEAKGSDVVMDALRRRSPNHMTQTAVEYAANWLAGEELVAATGVWPILASKATP